MLDRILQFIADKLSMLNTKIDNAISEYRTKFADPITYVGDVYWRSNSWTAPKDGICIAYTENQVGVSDAYWYVKDVTTDIYTYMYYGTTAGTYRTGTFPVKRGHSYTTASIKNIKTAHVYYYSLF